MTTREQINSGIQAAIRYACDEVGVHSGLPDLTIEDQDSLALHILGALVTSPEYTPNDATLLMQVSTLMANATWADVTTGRAGDLVAQYAADALADADEARDTQTDNPSDDDLMTDENWGDADSNREFREFMFGIQRLYGVRTRVCQRGDGSRYYRVAGTRQQVRAFQRVCILVDAAAGDFTTDAYENMTSDQRKTFWATLAALIVDSIPAADTLITANITRYQAATAHLRRVYGPARNLTRADSASTGTTFDAALALTGHVASAAADTL